MTDSKTPFFDAVEDIGKRHAAARTMLAALKDVHNCPDISDYQNEMIGNAIAQAEAAGVTTGEDDD